MASTTSNIRRTFVLCVVLSCVFLGTDSQSQNGTQPVTGDSGNGNDQTSIEKGMEVLYDMTNAFLEIVQTDKITELPWLNFSIIFTKPEIVTDSLSEWKNWLNYGRGYAACIVAGLLFFIIMPIFGLFFCCCRCCGKCGGGKKTMDPKHAKCKRISFCAVLLIFNTIMLAGVVCCFVSNDLIHSRLLNKDNNGPVGKVTSAFSTLNNYVDDTIQDVANKTLETFDKTRTELVRRINESAVTAVDQVAESLNATSLLNQAKDLAKDANSTKDELGNVDTILKKLIEMGQNLTTELNEIKSSVELICKNINCTINTTQYNTDADFTQLNNLSSVAGNVSQTLNMGKFVEEAEGKIKEVKKNSTDRINSEIESASSSLDSVRQKIKNQTDNFRDQVKSFTSFFKTAEDKVNTSTSDVKKYADYVYYGGIGVCCIYLLIVVLYYMGVLFGMCGERPGHDAPCCNKGMGSNFLMAGVGFSFLFSWLLILLIIILFIIGGPFYTEVCRYFVDHDPNTLKPFNNAMKNVIDLSKKLYKNADVDIDIVDVLNNCRANKPIYSTLKLDNLFNVSAVIDTTDVLGIFDEIANKTITFGNISLLSPGLKKDIQDFANSGLDGIDFDTYETQMKKKLVKANLTDLAEALFLQSSNVNQSGNAALAQNLTDNGKRLKALESQYVIPMEDEVKHLNDSLNSLKKHLDIQDKTKALLDGLQEAENKFNAEGTTKVTEKLKNVAEELKNLTQKRINSIIDLIEKAGKCKPVYESVYMMTDAVCVSVLNPLNGFWFSMGWCIFFFIPSIIFAVLLAGLYRREDEYEESKDFDDPNYPTYGGPHPDTIPLTSVNQHLGPEPGYSNSGYHRDDYRQPRNNSSHNNGYPAYGGGNPRPDYPGSKEPLPPAYGGGPQVYPSDHGFHGKPPKYSY
ncbi:prominin-1-like isoform X2 [Gigantopelta aegis]|uniref:prominin-1-like isoform X2 n=1 Tax=Gigantopelta aegis TaxID=1735272 RepID=UPI001B887F14|nr:prominin-1-like isoform X2 [Gigantopelta aegis]